MKRLFLFLMIALIFAGIAFARQIDYEVALKVADFHRFCLDQNQEYQITEPAHKILLPDGRTAAYVFILKPSGYIAIAPDKRFNPIIAYSSKSVYRPYSEDNILKSIIETDIYFRYQNVDQYSPDTIAENLALWNRYLSRDESLITEIHDYLEYGPWIQVDWSQGEPYNNYCPIDPETGERCVTGCTQTACAMILNYWRFPPSIILTEDDSYYSRHTTPDIYLDAPAASLDTIIYQHEGSVNPSMDMLARLMLAIGIVNRASYSSEGTSAEISDHIYNSRFGFTGTYDASPLVSGFIDRMARVLIKGKPIQMSIMSFTDGGHSIVTDGWREDGYFHLNMGWGGHEDGWYHLESGGLPEGYRWITRTSLNITAPPKPDVPSSLSDAYELYFMPVPQRFLNSIDDASDSDMYKFRADYDSSYVLYTKGPRDCRVEIKNSSGETIAEADTGGGLWNFWISFEPPEDGYFYAEITATDSLWDSNYQLF